MFPENLPQSSAGFFVEWKFVIFGMGLYYLYKGNKFNTHEQD